MIRRNLAWILFGLSLVLNIFFVGGFVYARHYGSPWGESGQWERRVDVNWPGELKLDASQQQMLRQSLREMRQRNGAKVRELRQIRERVAGEMRKDKSDFSVIDRLIEQAARLRSDIQKDGLRTADRIASNLRPEQQPIFREAVIARTMAPGQALRRMRREGKEEERR